MRRRSSARRRRRRRGRGRPARPPPRRRGRCASDEAGPTRPTLPFSRCRPFPARRRSCYGIRRFQTENESMSTDMQTTAKALVAPNKGILAADESFPTIGKRFDPLGIASTEANRQAYRQMLFSTPGAAEFISGVILFDETLRQKADDGTPFAEFLAKQGIIPGIKVDNGSKPLAGAPGEQITEGLDGLRGRLE